MNFVGRLKGTRITKADGVYLLIRLGFVVLMLPFGLIGLLIVVLTFVLLDRLIIWKFGLISMGTTDKNTWYDQESNRCNIMSVLILARTDESTLRQTFQHKLATDWQRFRCKMVKVLDSYYFQEL